MCSCPCNNDKNIKEMHQMYDEQRHHSAFIFKILKTRGQCPIRIENRRKTFIKRLKSKVKFKGKQPHDGHIFISTYDDVTKSHDAVKEIIRKSAKFRFSIIYKSLPSSAASICPKRKILQKLVSHFNTL